MNKTIVILLVALGSLAACSSNTKQPVIDTTKAITPIKDTDTIVVNKIWLGNWERVTHNANAGIDIKKIKGTWFSFSMQAGDGGHTGEIEGIAKITGDKALFISDEEKSCKLEFQLLGDSVIVVNESNECSVFGGIGVCFSGRYINSKRLTEAQKEDNAGMRDVQQLTVREDSIFKAMVGDSYKTFVSTTQMNEEDAKDLDGLNAKVLPSGIRGLYTYMENIIMIDSAKHMWAAVIDNDKVLYYTNRDDYKNQLPKTIEDWRSRFKQYPVIYKSK